MDLEPGGIFGWLVAGIVAGWITGQLTRGQGFGCIGNLVLGLAGAIIGGFLFSLVDFDGTAGLLASIVVATLGAIVLLAIANLVRR